MNKKKILFILGSGRCGTYSFVQALKKFSYVEAHHEFFFEPTLKLATLYHMKMISKNKVKSFILNNHYLSIKNSNKKIWVDSSNALPWIADVLIEIFPNAKFLHLIRNGKKVVSSFYNKFNNEMYKDENVKKLKNFLIHKKKKLSSEKKYWRPIPIYNKKEFNKFISSGQFYRICKYWTEINYKIENSLMSTNNSYTFKFEDIVIKKKTKKLLNFLDLYKKNFDTFYNSFKKPVNIGIKKNYMLTKKQNIIFNEVCNDEMIKYGYDETEYEVKY